MKTPTIKEVKEHFKNAKEVRCLESNEIEDISKDIVEEINYMIRNYWIRTKKSYNGQGSVSLWDNEKGYAEIISYKEPTYSINQEQLNYLLSIDSIKDEVKKWFGIEDKTPSDLQELINKYGKNELLKLLK